MKVTNIVLTAGMAIVLNGASAWAQATPAAPKPGAETIPARTTDVPIATRREDPCAKPDSCPVQIFHLTNTSAPNDANEIQTALRNLLTQDARIYLVPSQNAIIVRSTPEQIALAQKLVTDLDRPRKSFRLTYTITDMDNGRQLSKQHFAMIVEDGQRETLKQGSKVPIATGSYSSTNSPASAAQTQFQYLDVGMNFDATITSIAGGAVLKTKVEQSSVAEEKSIAGVQEPIIRQTTLEGTSVLTLGKPLTLGSIDVLGSTRHLDIEVTMEQLP